MEMYNTLESMEERLRLVENLKKVIRLALLNFPNSIDNSLIIFLISMDT